MKRFLIWAALLVLVGLAAYGLARGCCHFWAKPCVSGEGLIDQLGLTAAQRAEVAPVEADYMRKKKASCDLLCAKRAQLIQTLKQPEWDRDVMFQLVEEIGREQTLFEQETIDYIIAVSAHLDEPQKNRLKQTVAEELRTACQSTACGVAWGCSMKGDGKP